MAGGTSNMGKHLQIGTGKSLFYWSERVSEYTKEKVCDREKKTDVFSEKGRVNEERTPRVPSCSSPHTLLPHSLHVGCFCVSDSVIPGGQNRLSLCSKVCLSPIFSLPCLLHVCAVSTLIQVGLVVGLFTRAHDYSKRTMVSMKIKTKIITF